MSLTMNDSPRLRRRTVNQTPLDAATPDAEPDAREGIEAPQSLEATQAESATAPAAAPATTQRGPLAWWRRRKEVKQLEGSFDAYPHLLALKPREHYLFRSDYFEVDETVCCILAYFHDDAATDNFGPFWGIDRIPGGLADRVTAVMLEQIERQSTGWIDGFVKRSEKLDRLDTVEQAESGTTSSLRKAAKVSGDLAVTVGEIQDGASYLSVHNRLLLKAPSLQVLEDSIERITRLYIDRFGTLTIAPYAGEQRQELSALFRPNAKKRGKGFGFTSTELAGSYALVTNGLNDRTGEYVGHMVGDVNSSAVLMDVNDYERHVVIADAGISEFLGRQRVATMWCSKISQAALVNNRQVVHLILDRADLDQLGPPFARLTATVNLNSGDVNMFEMFGDENDELTVFAAQMEKLKLMFEQLYESTDGAIGSIIRGNLEAVATQFYIDQGMWKDNAQHQRHRLRVVNIPHDQVPRLQMFMAYLDTAHKALLNESRNDPDQLRALNVLRGIAASMLSTNGDLFNNHTASAIDGVRDSRRVLYDFSRLMRRGKGIAMAQLVNIVSFAVGKLGHGDTVIVHGAEHIDDRVKAYISAEFGFLGDRGGRVVYSYNDVDKMLADSAFNRFDDADYTLFGAMREATVAEYQKQLHQQIPPDLARLITRKDASLTYLRRGMTNVVFHLDLALGINPRREAERRTIALEAARGEQAAALATVMTTSKPVAGAGLSSLRGPAEWGPDSREGDEPDPQNHDAPAAQLAAAGPQRHRRSRGRGKSLTQAPARAESSTHHNTAIRPTTRKLGQ